MCGAGKVEGEGSHPVGGVGCGFVCGFEYCVDVRGIEGRKVGEDEVFDGPGFEDAGEFCGCGGGTFGDVVGGVEGIDAAGFWQSLFISRSTRVW